MEWSVNDWFMRIYMNEMIKWNECVFNIYEGDKLSIGTYASGDFDLIYVRLARINTGLYGGSWLPWLGRWQFIVGSLISIPLLPSQQMHGENETVKLNCK